VGSLHRSRLCFISNPGGVLLAVLTLNLLGQPIAKGRPRFSTHSGYAVAYTPRKTRNAESSLQAQAAMQLPSGFVPFKGPVAMTVSFRLQRPKSLKKSIQYPTKRPDLENFLKTLLDALNSVVFDDDSQVVSILATKEYGTPGIEVTIQELSEASAPSTT
jgi:Holliday junction resolvase RusA-like endonuclease